MSEHTPLTPVTPHSPHTLDTPLFIEELYEDRLFRAGLRARAIAYCRSHSTGELEDTVSDEWAAVTAAYNAKPDQSRKFYLQAAEYALNNQGRTVTAAKRGGGIQPAYLEETGEPGILDYHLNELADSSLKRDSFYLLYKGDEDD